ncbi:MAG: MBL fold metallo-hydrolase [archaeon]
MKIIIIVEDTKKENSFESEHGLSVYFEINNKKIMFDLSQSSMFLRNAKKLNIGLSDINYLVFSHGHYDHTGGFSSFPLNKNLKIIAHPDSILPKYAGERYIGFPIDKTDSEIDFNDEPVWLTESCIFLGTIPGERKASLGYYIKDNMAYDDFLIDDTALVIRDKKKLLIITGCAHSGIINIVKYAKQFFNENKIIIIGGFHMSKFTEKEIKNTIEELKKQGVAKVFPGHCTGDKAIKAIINSIGGEQLYSGKIIEV